MRRAILLICTLALILVVPCSERSAEAQGVVADLTTHDVAVTVDFSGANVVLFGSILSDAEDDGANIDVVVEVIGPTQPVWVRQKFRTGGIWINDEGRHVARAPGYYAVVSTRPLEEIAPEETFLRLGIGFEGLKSEISRTMLSARDEETQDYLDALVRVLADEGLYLESPGGAQIVGGHLFRAEIELAANVPLGSYDALVYLFKNQEMTGQHQTQLTIEKAGFERIVYTLAFEQPLLYGILCVIVAGMAGMGAAYVLQRK